VCVTSFGVPVRIEDLLFTSAASSIAFVPCRDEQGAAFIADVWGRLTGKAGVCLATLGPGATNLLTGVADANFDKARLVAITGQGGLDRLHHESHQRIDVVRMFESATKWNSVNLELVEKLKRYWQRASRALPRTREMS
jgi:acetolactate synthase I/II/III large subunit